MTEQQGTFKEEQRRNKAPIQFALFKGVTGKFGAMRLKLKKAYTDTNRNKDDGCIFLEMAPAVGANMYDWENSKIIMALSIIDIPKIILYLRSPTHQIFQNDKADGKLKIYHDKGAGTNLKGQNTTNLTLDKPKDRNNFFLSAVQTKEGKSKTASVTISPDEANYRYLISSSYSFDYSLVA